MGATGSPESEAFRRFLQRVWREDVTPLLRGPRAVQRRRAARVTGQVAASAGLLVDSLLRLKGRPFSRFLTVFGSTVGALLPDAWDWNWLRERASAAQKKVIADQVERRATELPLAEALALFHLTPTASRARLTQAWREASLRWHPDKAENAAAAAEYQVQFIALRAAYERLCQAYDENRLPQPPSVGPRPSASE